MTALRAWLIALGNKIKFVICLAGLILGAICIVFGLLLDDPLVFLLGGTSLILAIHEALQ